MLRAKDELAPGILMKWATELIIRGGDKKMAKMVTDHAVKMVEWQEKKKTAVNYQIYSVGWQNVRTKNERFVYVHCYRAEGDVCLKQTLQFALQF